MKTTKADELFDEMNSFLTEDNSFTASEPLASDDDDALPLNKTVIQNFKNVLRKSDDSYLRGWLLFPERNGTLFLQNNLYDAGINIGAKDFSYFINKDGKVTGENAKRFSPEAVIETMKKICV